MLNYREYHNISMEIGDVDPSYEMLRYVCDRFELNIEQRYWLAFLYATCYCGPTVFYMYNEFPDFEKVDFGRLERWWNSHKSSLIFQTDRQRVRSTNVWVPTVKSYFELIRPLTQAEKFSLFIGPTKFMTYISAWEEMIRVRNFGRFSMFLYLEAVHVVTGFPMEPWSMDINRDNESCRNGLLWAFNRQHLIGQNMTPREQGRLQDQFDALVAMMRGENPKNSVWNIETTLCAYKKYRKGQRHPGHYLNRQGREIAVLQSRIRDGVDWSVLWDYRRETYRPEVLQENVVGMDPTSWDLNWGRDKYAEDRSEEAFTPQVKAGAAQARGQA